jgi:predicted nucleic acid-binding protein
LRRLLVLVDKSALVWLADREPITDGDDELCLCAVTRLEMLYSARSPDDYSEIEVTLDAFRHLRMDVETFAVASAAQRKLAAAGKHRVPLPDLLIAACAQQHSANVLHLDRRYDTLASVLSFGAIRLAAER